MKIDHFIEDIHQYPCVISKENYKSWFGSSLEPWIDHLNAFTMMICMDGYHMKSRYGIYMSKSDQMRPKLQWHWTVANSENDIMKFHVDRCNHEHIREFMTHSMQSHKDLVIIHIVFVVKSQKRTTNKDPVSNEKILIISFIKKWFSIRSNGCGACIGVISCHIINPGSVESLLALQHRKTKSEIFSQTKNWSIISMAHFDQ